MTTNLYKRDYFKMTNNKTCIVAVASWEDRFVDGAIQSLSSRGVEGFVCIFSSKYRDDTKQNREHVSKLCNKNGVAFEEYEIDFENQIPLFRGAQEVILKHSSCDIVFDISTAPRNVLWTILYLIERLKLATTIRYYSASKYGEWQTDDEGDPRLVVNQSGLIYPELPTCLLLLCGPEVSRAEKMLYHFEPRRVYIIRDLHAENYGHVKAITNDTGANITEIVVDQKLITAENLQNLTTIVDEHRTDYNIVCASFGPKLGAVFLYCLRSKYPDLALGYVPSGKHNLDFSEGIGSMSDTQFPIPL